MNWKDSVNYINSIENYSDYKKIGAHVISNSGSNWFKRLYDRQREQRRNQEKL